MHLHLSTTNLQSTVRWHQNDIIMMRSCIAVVGKATDHNTNMLTSYHRCRSVLFLVTIHNIERANSWVLDVTETRKHFWSVLCIRTKWIFYFNTETVGGHSWYIGLDLPFIWGMSFIGEFGSSNQPLMFNYSRHQHSHTDKHFGSYGIITFTLVCLFKVVV